MSQPVPYQSPVIDTGSNLISPPWGSFFDSLTSGDGGSGSSEQVSWIPEEGPISPHGQEASFRGSISRPVGSKLGERISVADFGAVGDGGTDDAPAFNLAIQAAINKPGCEIYVPGGYKYLINSSIRFNGGSTPLTMAGDGASSVILCGTQVANGVGFIDITGSDVTLRSFLIDGQKTQPDHLEYNRDFQGQGGNDPLASSLAQGTSIWIHAGCARIILDGLAIQHTRGYAVLLNATEGADILDCDIRNCWFLNNRPALFGIAQNDLNYGSWNGGIMFHGDGRSGAPFMVRGLSVSNCHWRRCNGNAIWSHLYGFASLHENIRISDNDFVDNGLDCIQFGGVCGGVCTGNYARRVGYICSDDGVAPGVPRWLNGAWASFLDTSGQVIGVDYAGNTGISINGDGINLDGYSNGTVVGNTLRQPLRDEPEYITDQIGVAGFAGSSSPGGPNFAHGMLSSNTSNDLPGGDSIVVVGNTVLNFSCGAILLYAGRRCVIQSNNIEHPADATEVPIVLGNVGTGDQQRTYDSAVYGNRIGWKPTSPRPCIREDASLAPFAPGDSNHVGVNTIIPVSGNAYGFESATTSSSKTEVRFDSNQPGLGFPSYYFMQSEGAADTSVLRWYYAENLNTPAIAMQLQSRYGPGKIGTLFNISLNGAADTGVISTGARTNSNIPDAVLSGHFYSDGFMVLTDATYSDRDANAYPDSTWALLRYRPGIGHIEQSLSVSGGQRIWTALGGQAGGPVNSVQYNGGGSTLAGTSNFAYDPVNQRLFVNGPYGSGIIAVTFNSTASGTQQGLTVGGGSGFVTGAGLAGFQQVVAKNVYAGGANQDGTIAAINGDCFAYAFNSPATGADPALVVNNGAAIIFGNGNLQSQQVIARNIYAGGANSDGSIAAINGDCYANRFNSPATGTTQAITVNSGAAMIYGNGNLQSQQVIARNIYAGGANSDGSIAAINGDCYANRFNSPSTGTTQALTVNDGAAIIFGSGDMQGQSMSLNWIGLSITSAPAAVGGKAVLYADSGSSQLMVSFSGGPFVAIGSGGGAGSVNIQSAGTPIGSATTINFSTNLSVSIVSGVATVTASSSGGTVSIQANGTTIGSATTLNFTTNMGVSISSGVATISSTGGSGGSGISGVKTSDGAAYSTSGGYAILSFINSAGLINTSAASFGGTVNANNYQISGNNGDTVNVSYTGLDGSTHTLSFLRGILIGHS